MDQNLEYKNGLNSKFKEFEASLNGEKDSLMHKIRIEALSNFNNMNLPTTQDEDWRFTNIAPIFRHSFNPAVTSKLIDKGMVNSAIYSKLECPILVFVNGKYSTELSRTENLPDGLSFTKMPEFYAKNNTKSPANFYKPQENTNIFTELNTAFAYDGMYLTVPKNFATEVPIYILYIADSADEKYLLQPRTIVLSGENSQIHIIEHFISQNDSIYFTNSLTNFHLAPNAKVKYTKLQEESNSSYHISNTNVLLEKDSNFSSHLVSLGGKISRNNIYVKYKDIGGYSSLNGLYLTDNEQLFDLHTIVDHAVPHCNSSEHFKGILDGRSRAVFNGKVFVRQDAQKTNAFQENNNIILSNDALVNTKPQLEIFADDVKCSHGATIGQLDEEAMFYLRSRGIGEENARSLLIHAFASEVFKDLKIDVIKDYLEEILTHKFESQ